MNARRARFPTGHRTHLTLGSDTFCGRSGGQLVRGRPSVDCRTCIAVATILVDLLTRAERLDLLDRLDDAR